jgi:hypothetical protein
MFVKFKSLEAVHSSHVQKTRGKADRAVTYTKIAVGKKQADIKILSGY